VAIGVSPLISMLPWWIKAGRPNSLSSAHISIFVTHAWKFYYNKSDGANSEKHRRLYSFYGSTDYLLANIQGMINRLFTGQYIPQWIGLIVLGNNSALSHITEV